MLLHMHLPLPSQDSSGTRPAGYQAELTRSAKLLRSTYQGRASAQEPGVLEPWVRRSTFHALCSQRPKFGLLWPPAQSLSSLFVGNEAGPAAPAGALQDASSQQAGGLDCEGDSGERGRPCHGGRSPGSSIFVPLLGRNLRTGASRSAGSP